MLTRLTIQNVVLIENLTLDLAAGLNVFTGETGAGKSILLDALGLALGGRSDASLIRNGTAQASVAAEFAFPLPKIISALLNEQGFNCDETLILRRVITKDGKSRAFVNDQPVSIGLLKQFGEGLLEIHGQFETHGLLNPSTHCGLLDAFAGLSDLREKTASAFTAWKKADKDYQDTAQACAQAKAEEDFLSAAVAELEELDPQAGEIDKLAARRASLQNSGKIIEALQTTEQLLNSEKSASSFLAQAGKAIAKIANKAPELSPLLSEIDRLASDVGEVGQKASRLLYEMEAEPNALQNIEDRLFELRAVARKYGIAPEELHSLKENLSRRLALLANQSDKLSALSKAVDTSKHEYKKLAEKLSEKRGTSAKKLAKDIMAELPSLKFERAQFVVDIEKLPEDQWNGNGMDRVVFMAAANPGSAPGALHKVASGGELSRFMLALKVVLAASDPIPVLVFDEVDTGIGGATASAVGDRLAKLAKDVQVFVVTHSPQVAARGKNHIRVTKRVSGKSATTEVAALNRDERIEEIARMLAGNQTTDAARKAAISLLNDKT